LRLGTFAAFDGIDYRQNNVINVLLLVHIVRECSALHNAAVNSCLDETALKNQRNHVVQVDLLPVIF